MSRRAVNPKLWLALTCTLCTTATVVAQPQTPPVRTPAPVTPAPTTPATPPPAAPVQTAPAPVTTPAPAAPLPTAAEATPAAKEAARVAYTRGQAAFAQGQFETARIAFEEAFAAVPNPIVLLSVSESRAKLGQIKEAIAPLERYLQLRPDAPDRVQIEEKIKALANTPATVAVTSVPAGAALSIDDAPAAQHAPAQLSVPPGKHTLTYSLLGYKTNSESLEVEPGARYELEIVLQTAPPEPPPPPAPVAATTPPPPAASETPVAALWITGGLGAAGIITGTVLGFLALEEQSDFESNPTEAGADRGERLALFADVGFGVGIMALATTAVLLFTSGDAPAEAAPPADQESARRHKPRASLELIPKLSPDAASATARVRF